MSELSKSKKSRSVSIEHLDPIDFRTLADDIADMGEWLVEPLIPTHRQTAIVAEGGVGKSLIMLEIAAALATGHAILHRPASTPIHVVYVDMEMTPSDLADRLEAFGYDFTNDRVLQEHLHYYQLQSFDAFDKRRGGRQLLAVAERDQAELVVIDTLARVVEGNENDASTFHDFAAWTGTPLKALGTTVVRLDHLGKDKGKGARGSSAKRDDIDLGWTMTPSRKHLGGFTFAKEKTRIMWAPEQVVIQQTSNEPLKHEVVVESLSKEASVLLGQLDSLDIPSSWGRNRAGKALREAGFTASTNDLAEALAFRARRAGQASNRESWKTIGQASRTGDHPVR